MRMPGRGGPDEFAKSTSHLPVMIPGVPPSLRAVARRRKTLVVCTFLIFMAILTYHHRPTAIPAPPREITVVTLDPAEFPELTQQYRQGEGTGPTKLLVPPESGSSTASTHNPTGTPEHKSVIHTKTLVVARTSKETVDWVYEQYTVEEPTGPRTTSIDKEWELRLITTDALDEFHTPVNKGREAMAYLTYIIGTYQNLSDVSVFMHAHRSSWHDNYFELDAPGMVRNLNLDRVSRMGYMNLRCQWMPGCPDWIHPMSKDFDIHKPEENVIALAWRELFPGKQVPATVAGACCAQFAITAERLRRVPLATYVSLRDWLLTTELEDAYSGRVFEYLYHYLWTGHAVWCPSEHSCYCDGYGVCFEGKAQLAEWFSRLGERDTLDYEKREWVKEGGDEALFEAQDPNFFIEEKLQEEERRFQETIPPQENITEVHMDELARRKQEMKDEMKNLVDISSTVRELDKWLNEASAKAKNRGKDPAVRAAEAAEAFSKILMS